MIHRRLIITGRVQGVFFRDWTVMEARRHGLSGWVRNRRDGSVEVHVAGPEEAVDALTAACRTGPPRARVDGVTVTAVSPESLDGFQRRPTA